MGNGESQVVGNNRKGQARQGMVGSSWLSGDAKCCDEHFGTTARRGGQIKTTTSSPRKILIQFCGTRPFLFTDLDTYPGLYYCTLLK